MSNVSFSDSDITRIRFSDKVTWGGDDKFTIIEEKRLIEEAERRKKNKLNNKSIEKRNNDEGQSLSPELVLSVYRNLRENYEFRLRYGDAGKFFIKEMELKRKYRESSSVSTFKLKLIKSFRKSKLRDISELKVVSFSARTAFITAHTGSARTSTAARTGCICHFT